jgi:hypothetical protein
MKLSCRKKALLELILWGMDQYDDKKSNNALSSCSIKRVNNISD